VIGQLAADFTGSYYDQIPRGLFNIGGAGLNGWRTTCGVAYAGALVLKLVTNTSNVVDEYLAWFERTPFPSNAAHDDYVAAAGTWTLNVSARPAPADNAPKSVGKGLLCHATHGRWLEAAGGVDGAWVTEVFAGNAGMAGMDRCSKLVYDATYKMAELINDWAAGTVPTPVLDPSVDTCLTSGCHGGAGAYDQAIIGCAPEINGKMKCDEACHQ